MSKKTLRFYDNVFTWDHEVKNIFEELGNKDFVTSKDSNELHQKVLALRNNLTEKAEQNYAHFEGLTAKRRAELVKRMYELDDSIQEGQALLKSGLKEARQPAAQGTCN